MTHLEDYANKYRFIKFERRDGVLAISIHQDGSTAKWSAFPNGIHDELGDAFLTELDFSEPDPDGLTPKFWDRIYKEGKDLLMNLLDIEVPIIGAVNGPAFIHAELLTLSDIVIASDNAAFADKAHSLGGVVPGDGVHIWWPMLLGPNRGQHFLLTGEEISAQEGKDLGFVAEVVPHKELMDRAWQVATELAQKPPMMLRYTRVACVQHIKRRMQDDLGYGLMLEGMSILSSMSTAD